jgi:hypothetical protein
VDGVVAQALNNPLTVALASTNVPSDVALRGSALSSLFSRLMNITLK